MYTTSTKADAHVLEDTRVVLQDQSRLGVMVHWTLSLAVVVLLAASWCRAENGGVLEVVENSGVNRKVGQLFAETVASTSFEFTDTVCGEYFTIDATATVYTLVDVDREAVLQRVGSDQLTCRVQYEQGSSQHLKHVTIHVLDVNDEVPGFHDLTHPVHNVTVLETLAQNSPITALQPNDRDKGANGTVVFTITAGNEDGMFRLDPPTPDSQSPTKYLYLNNTLDYETKPQYNLTITISDMGVPHSLNNTQHIVIVVSNREDQQAQLLTSMFSFVMPENHPVGDSEPVGTIIVQYQDGSVIYTLLSSDSGDLDAQEFFTVAPLTGHIYLKKQVDYENLEHHFFRFEAEVKSSGSNLATQAIVEVEVVDVNDEAPYFVFDHSTVTEMTTPLVEETEVNEPIILLKGFIEDGDLTSNFQMIEDFFYTVEPALAASYVTATPVSLPGIFPVIVHLIRSIDREEISEFTLTLTASDNGSPPNTASLVIHLPVLDLNDNPPSFTNTEGYSTRIAEDSPVGKAIAFVKAVDPDFAENGTIRYSITSVDNPEADGWFSVDSNGTVTVASQLKYSSLTAGKAAIVITAHDDPTNTPPLSSSTTLLIELAPGVTFAPRSFQEHTGYDILSTPRTTVYLEFRSTEQNGLLIYQIGPNNRTFSLGIEGGKINYRFGSGGQLSQRRDEQQVSDDKWYSVQVSREGEDLQLAVWRTDRQDHRVTEILQPSTLASCPEDHTDGPSLYVGGLDLFSLPENATFVPGLLGAITNLIVDGTQVDLSCPSREENTGLDFVHTEDGCAVECGEGSVCVNFASESYCSCLGGFPPEACTAGYDPITFTGEESAELTLGYSFFFDLSLHGDLSIAPQEDGRRRRREDGSVKEVVRVVFRPVDVMAGNILYSRTAASEHRLQILRGSDEMTFIIYTVFEPARTTETVRVRLSSQLLPSNVYSVAIITTNSDVTLTIDGEGVNGSTSVDWQSNPVMAFAQSPETVIAMSPQDERFTGCILALSINSIPVPLSGLARAGGSQFTASGTITDSCDLCTLTPCPENSTCVTDTLGASRVCPCLNGYIPGPHVNSCVLPPTTAPSPTLEEVAGGGSDDQFPFYYIIGIALGGILIFGFVSVIVILFLRCRYRSNRQRRTYHIDHNGETGERSPAAKPNPYTNVVPRLDESFRRSRANSRANTPGPPDSESVATYQQHDMEEDEGSSKRTSSFSRRKSTTSAETGFHTGSERDERDERSIPRMEDSGNEKETDYSPFDSDSERSTSCLEEAISPANIALRASPDNVMGVPPSPYHVPLTPKEQKVMEPLRPDSRLILSMSEFEDETDTEFSYPPQHLLSKFPKSRTRDSDMESRPSNSPSWYKASTASDTERESTRAQGTCAYYPHQPPPHRPPFNKSKSMPMPPEYFPPPTISSHKSTSPSHFPQFYPPALPAHTHLAASPLSHTMFKYGHSEESSLISEPKRDIDPRSPSIYSAKPKPFRLHSVESYSPHHTPPRHYTFSPGFGRGEVSPAPAEGPAQFQDLKSMKSRINPIAYWEGQSRMRATVDQVDPYQILSEPFVQFEDVSTQTSIVETGMLSMDERAGPEHQEFSNQGGMEGTADISVPYLPADDVDTLVTSSTEVTPPIKHFPSADCSEDYAHSPSLGTLVASSSDDSTPKQLNGYSVPSSQQPFDV